MFRPPFPAGGRLLTAAAFLVVGLAAPGRAAGPIAPDKAAAALTMGAGLEAALFASEPMLSSPADIDVDAKGRVWVCEVTNYRGRKDTRKEGDRILVLEDTDGDGKADKSTVFHQGRDVDSALGICVIGEGPGRKVIVSCAPDVFVFHDDDGDLVADRKESLFTKTGQPQHDHSVHAFVVGPDGRWYFNFGNTGNAVHDKDGKPVSDRFGNIVSASGRPFRQGMVFRCRPDGSDFEVLGWNFRNNYEVAPDSFGTLWQSDNDDDGNRGVRINWVMEYGNYGYVDEKTGAGWQSARVNAEPETPQRHWHQNDPGVVPNLLLTGAGSPTGMCVYEGSLLPEVFRGAPIHCDAGPNVVRAYPVTPSGAGYAATIENVAQGSADPWFRPSDVCVAPDGSLIVADWYDPGVGGHGMGDIDRGRIYRIAPVGSKWTVPSCDLTSVAGAVAALASPNLCTRATALERIAKEPGAAAAALDKAFAAATDPRLKSRLAWAAGMLPDQGAGWISRLSNDADADLRIVALRLARALKADVIAVVEKFVGDASPAVRREAAIALRGIEGERADRAWAELAARHSAGDRWELEALGVGADGPGSVNQWDGRFTAWLAKIGGRPKSPADREIVWRSRAAATPALLADAITDPATGLSEALPFIRALDFQDPAIVREAVPGLVKRIAGPEDKIRALLPELVLRLDGGATADPEIARLIDRAMGFVAGSERFVELARRFSITSRVPDLAAVAADRGKGDGLGAKAVAAALDLGGGDVVRAAVARGDEQAVQTLTVLGVHGDAKAMTIIDDTLRDAGRANEVRVAAIRAKARTEHGAKQLVAMAKAGEITGPFAQAAALAISACPWGHVRQEAADVLPLPKAKGGGSLPPVADLLHRGGNAGRGKGVFAGAGTCAKCHVVEGEGRAVGPDLSGIGAKLPKAALYEAVLAPSAAISHSFETWTAVRTDGRSATGLLISRSPTEIVIRGADGIDIAIPAAELEELVKQPVSLMPADLATTLTADELVDLVAYLETLRTTR